VTSLQFPSKRLNSVRRHTGGRTRAQYGLPNTPPPPLSLSHQTKVYTNEHFTLVLVKFRDSGLGQTPDWTSKCHMFYQPLIELGPVRTADGILNFKISVKFNISLNASDTFS
jgi:hypothetical protein